MTSENLSDNFWISMELSNSCKLNCKACHQNVSHNEDRFMPVKKAVKLIESISKWRFSMIKKCSNANNYCPEINLNDRFKVKLKLFWMGESLLHPDFIEILKSLQFHYNTFSMIALDTGGHALSDKIANELLILSSFVPVHLNFTLDAVCEKTYKIIKTEDPSRNLAKAEAGLLRMKTLRTQNSSIFPILSVQFIVQEENESEAGEFIERWKKIFGADTAIITDGSLLYGNSDCIFIKKDENTIPGSIQEHMYFNLMQKLQLPCNNLSLHQNNSTITKEDSSERPNSSELMIRFDGRTTTFCSDFNCDHSIGNAFSESLPVLIKKSFLKRKEQSHGTSDASTSLFSEKIDHSSSRNNSNIELTISSAASPFSLIFPSSLSFVVSETCPLNCIMCVQKNLENPDSLMSLRYFKSIIDRLNPEINKGNGLFSSDTSNWKPSLIFNCFESFANPEFPDMLEYALLNSELWSTIKIDTNAQLLSPIISDRLVEALRKCPSSSQKTLMELNVSLDAVNSHTYRKIRTGSLENAEKNICYLLKIRKAAGLSGYLPNPGLRLQFLALRENHHEAEEFAKKWLDLLTEFGAEPELGSNHKIPSTDSVMIKQVVPNNKYPESDEVFENICSRLSLPVNKYFYTNAAEQTLKNLPCGWPFSTMIFRADGSLTPCQPMWKENLSPAEIKQLKINHALGKKNDPCTSCSDATLSDGEHIHAIMPALDCLLDAGLYKDSLCLANKASHQQDFQAEYSSCKYFRHILSRMNYILSNANQDSLKNPDKKITTVMINACQEILRRAPADLKTREMLTYLHKENSDIKSALDNLEKIPWSSRTQELLVTRAWLYLESAKKMNVLENEKRSERNTFLKIAIEQARNCIENVRSSENMMVLAICLIETDDESSIKNLEEAEGILTFISESDSAVAVDAQRMLESISKGAD